MSGLGQLLLGETEFVVALFEQIHRREVGRRPAGSRTPGKNEEHGDRPKEWREEGSPIPRSEEGVGLECVACVLGYLFTVPRLLDGGERKRVGRGAVRQAEASRSDQEFPCPGAQGEMRWTRAGRY